MVRRLRGWIHDWGGILLLGLGGYLLLFTLWWFYRWGPAELELLVVDLPAIPGTIIAAVLAWRVSIQTDQRERLAWRLIALAQASWFLGDVLWTYFGHVLQGSPFPSLAALFYAGFFPLTLGALVALTSPMQQKGDQLRTRIALGAALLAGGSILWLLVVRPGLRTENANLLSGALSVLYPVGDLMLLCGVARLLVAQRQKQHRAVLRLLATGTLAYVVGDVGFSHLNLRGAYSGYDWPDLFWTAGAFFIALGAQTRWNAPSPLPRIELNLRRRPFLSLLFTTGLISWLGMVVMAHLEGLHRFEWILYVGLTLTGLIVFSQMILLQENDRLLAESEALTATLREREAELRHQAFHDPLTGLANRALFLQEVERALANHEQVAVFYLDLDGFKMVNDSLGHEAGDHLLTLAASRFQASLPSESEVARLGGDEFAIKIEAPDEATAVAAAERIIESLGRPFQIGGKDLFVRTSLGIAFSTGGTTGAAELLRNADIAMYAAKGVGHGRYVLYEPTMHGAALGRLELEADLSRAIDNEEFVLYYQPLVDLQTERVVGVEALLRWRHPKRGLILPDTFVPIAEESGLIEQIGRWVLLEACAQTRRWHDRYPHLQPLTVSVNLSGKQIQHPGLLDEVAQALATTGLDPSFLVIEITEGVLMRNRRATTKVLEQLKGLGIRLAVDDFGTGYSSLSYLHQFPVDIVKIDRSFVQNLSKGPKHKALARCITDLTAALELQTVAEGIEEAWQVKELRQLNYQMGQGFFFARPVAARIIDTLLQQGRISCKR